MRNESAKEATNRYMSSLRSHSFCESRGWKRPASPLPQANERVGVVEDDLGKEQLTADGWVVVYGKNELMRP